MKKLIISILLLLALVAVGCGGDGGFVAKPVQRTSTSGLTYDENLSVAKFELDVAQTIYDSSAYGSLLKSMDVMITLTREKPDAIYETKKDKRTLRQVLADAAGDLQKYQPDLANKLELTIQTLPAAR